jgi:hypothetical protein
LIITSEKETIMKQQKVFLGVIMIITSTLVGARAMAQERRSPPNVRINVTEEEKAAQRRIEARRPGEHRQSLNVLIGNWTTTWKNWQKPGSEPDVSGGTTRFTWGPGRRYVQGNFAGTLKGVGPGKQGPPHDIPFRGVFTLEYDTTAFQYTSSWTNSLEPSKVSSRGIARANAAARINSMELRGTCQCQAGGGEVAFRSVIDISNPGRIVEEGFTFDESGREFKATEIIYTRVKPQGVRRSVRTKM